MDTYKQVRSLKRGLDVLAALNAENGASVQRISARAGLHRATVYRILETLLTLGYVRKSGSDDSYRLNLKVRELSDGFDDDAWVSATAAPRMGALLRDVIWPTDLTTYDVDAMVIRETTHRFSPFSIHHAMVGKRLPVLSSAAGRAYLAFCPPRERATILGTLAAAESPERRAASDLAAVAHMVRLTREQGFGASVGEVDKRMSAIAVPIHWSGRVLACLGMVFFTSSLSVTKAGEQYAPALKRAAEEIEKALDGHLGAADEGDEGTAPAQVIPAFQATSIHQVNN